MGRAEIYIGVCLILSILGVLILDICMFSHNLSKFQDLLMLFDLQLVDFNVTYDILHYDVPRTNTSYITSF